MLKKLHSILEKKDKHYLFFLLIFSIFISAIETIGISAIMPFIKISSDFETIHTNEYYNQVYTFFQFKNEINFVVSLGILMVLFYIFRSLINLYFYYKLTSFSQKRYHFLAYKLLENYMGMSYKNFVRKNTSYLTKSIINEALNLTSFIQSFLLLLSEVFVVIFIYSIMLYINVKITLVLTLILFINAMFLTKTVSKKIKQIGILRASVQEKFYEIINKSFGNFKLIKLQNHETQLLDEFKASSSEYARINITNGTLSQFPRLFLEAVGFGIITSIITFLVWSTETNIMSVLPIISMFVLALYRLMPSANRIMNNYNAMLFYRKSLDIVHADLTYHSEDLGEDKIEFNSDIKLQDIQFEYDEGKSILNGISLNIKRGTKIAFVGESGSGKSTLVDLIIGLYKPQHGKISIDGKILDDNNIKSWRLKIGYIPQSIYLFDGTVGENVSFGYEYDKEKVHECLKKAKMLDFLKTKEGQDTLVGEGGIMLSGGQKQRIAIARALYINPEILVLDEATSALDSNIEKEIMQEIYSLSENRTLIIIAHRLTTLEQCDKIYKLESGRISNE